MEIAEVAGALDEVWLVVAAVFMQAGFALVEAGFIADAANNPLTASA